MGGQGIITLAFILGQACLFHGKNATQTQSYGPEARGSVCRSEVIIAEEEIDYPWVVQPDILVAMSQDAYNRYRTDVKTDGIIIIDPDLVTLIIPDPAITLYRVQATKTASFVLGNAMVANVVMFGALTAITKVIDCEAAQKSIVKRWPNYAKLNTKAFRKGMELGTTALLTSDAYNLNREDETVT
jgi:2-oxoglutarate ferredoxin oxidoreductase subunit gamma